MSAVATPVYRHEARLRIPRGKRPRSRTLDHGSPIPTPLVDEVLAAFGLVATGPGRIEGPSRADNVVIESRSGTKLLKRYKQSVDEAAIDQEHSIIRYLATIDFPAPRLARGPDGATARQIADRWYAVFDYIPGYFHFNHYLWTPRRHLDLVGLSARALASLHGVLRDFVPDGSSRSGFVSHDGPRWREIDWYLAALENVRAHVASRTTAESATLRNMVDGRGKGMEQELRALDTRLRNTDLCRQVIHADYGPYNILLRAGEPVMILDFELARIDWRIADVAKSLQQFAVNRYGLRMRRLERFVTEYDAAHGLTSEERRAIPAVWLFLTLRRIVVCWDRLAKTGERRWLVEAEGKLRLAEIIVSAADRLSHLEGLRDEV